LFTLIANISAIPGSPSNNDYVEIGDSTGIQSFSPLSGLPSGFVGATGLTVRLRYQTATTSWVFMSYFANDSESRYLTKNIPVVTGDSTNGSGQITLNCENNSHGVKIKGPPHSAAATYTLTLPDDTGTSGYVLKTDGSGSTSWGGADVVFDTTPQLGGDLDVNGHEIVSGGSNTDIIIDAARHLTLKADSNGTNGEVQIVGGPLNCASITNASVILGATPTLRGSGTSGTASLSNYGSSANSIDSDLRLSPDRLDLYFNSDQHLHMSKDGDLEISNTTSTQRGIAFYGGSTNNFLTIRPPSSFTTTTYYLPTADGSAGEVLSTDGSGNMSWASADKITEGNTSAEVIDTGSDGRFVVTTEGSERMRIDSTGNVFIGGTTAATADIALNANGSATFANTVMSGGDPNDGSNVGTRMLNTGMFQAARSSGASAVWTGYTQGTTDPTSRINGNGEAQFAGRLLVGTTTEGHTSADTLTISDSTNSGLTIRSGTSSQGSIYFSDATTGAGEYAGYMRYDHNYNNFAIGTVGTERLRIDSSGRLFAGGTVATPSTTSSDDIVIAGAGNVGLTINSTNSAESAIFFADGTSGSSQYMGQVSYYHSTDSLIFASAGSERLRIDSSGRVMIGTTSQGHVSADDLTISSSGSTGMTIRSDSSGYGSLFFADAGSDYAGAVEYQHSTDTLRFYVGSTNRLQIAPAGQIGLGGANYGTAGQVITSNGSGSAPTWQDTSIPALATQAEAEAGTNNTKMMTPLRVAQAINALGGSVINSIQRGTFQVGSYTAGYYGSVGPTNTGPTNITITSVDTTKTMVNNTGVRGTDGATLTLSSATQLTGYRGYGQQNQVNAAYEIIEFK
jgi:hypothetical protein